MPYTLDATRSKAVERGGVVVAAVAVFHDSGAGPDVALRWARATNQTPAQFRTMLLGAGTIAAPQGELGAWLAQLNAPADVETAL